MAKFVLDWEVDDIFDFSIIGIIASVRPHRLAFALNQVVNPPLFRTPADAQLKTGGRTVLVPLFRPEASDQIATNLVLIENYGYYQPESAQLGLFSQVSPEIEQGDWQRQKLIKNLKNFDFFLLIFGVKSSAQISHWTRTLRRVDEVTFAEEIKNIESISGAEVLLEIEPITK